MTDGAGVRLFALGIGRYKDPTFASLRVTEEIRRITRILRPLAVEPSPPWPVAMLARDGDAVIERLLAWAQSPPALSILYWLGHGWSHGTDRCGLAHSRSQGTANGISPEEFAEPIVRWANRAPAPPGLVVIIDACKSDTFAAQLHARLNSRNVRVPRLIIGTSDQGSTNLGDFSNFLGSLLENVYRGQEAINLSDLARQIEVYSEPPIFPQQRGIARTDLRTSWPGETSPPAVSKTETRIVVGPSATGDHRVTDDELPGESDVSLETVSIGGKSTSAVVKEIGDQLSVTWPAGARTRELDSLGGVLGGLHDYPGRLYVPIEAGRYNRRLPGMTEVMRQVARQPGVTVVVTTPKAQAVEVARGLYTPDDTEQFGEVFLRLVRRRSGFRSLFTALALSEGRGLPLRDGVWIAFADAISEAAASGKPSFSLAGQLISAAADYLTTGSEHGQTVYRLARAGYDELVLARAKIDQPSAQLAVTRAGVALLAGRTDRAAADAEAPPVNSYLRRHLRSHARKAGPEGLALLSRHETLLR